MIVYFFFSKPCAVISKISQDVGNAGGNMNRRNNAAKTRTYSTNKKIMKVYTCMYKK